MSRTDIPRHPLQPIVSVDGVLRFKENALVRKLVVDAGGLSVINGIEATREDREQLAMLIGSSLNGFSQLTYVTDETVDLACATGNDPDQLRSRIARLEGELTALRDGMRDAVARLYGIDPDVLDGGL